MEMMLHACIPSFMSMRGTVDELGSDFKENYLRLFVVVYKLSSLAFVSYTNTRVPIIIYCLVLYVD